MPPIKPPTKWIAEDSAGLPLAAVASQGIRARMAGIQYYLPRAAFLWEEDPEHVHQLRVASRRSAATIELFASLLPRKRLRGLLRQIKQIRRSADAARDLDVYLQRLGEPSDKGAGSLARRLEKLRRKAQTPIVEMALPLLTSEPLAPRVDRLLKKIENSPAAAERYGPWSASKLRQEWSEFIAHMPPPQPKPDQLHEFRIAGKHFRYVLEILSGGLPAVVRKEIYPQVERLQGKLGTIQDHAVAAERLSDWQSETHRPTEKRFLAQLEADEREQFAADADAFCQWWHPDHVGQLTALIDQVVREARSEVDAS